MTVSFERNAKWVCFDFFVVAKLGMIPIPVGNFTRDLKRCLGSLTTRIFRKLY